MNAAQKRPVVVPVARPLLPAADRLLPYLRSIDESRSYSNFGPQVRALENEICQHYRTTAGSVVTVANATLGLALALAAQHVTPGALCLIPAWSFAASAHAAVLAGLQPYFVDVDAGAGIFQPDAAAQIVAKLPPGAVGAVMPVAPFGHPVNTAAWDRFHEQTRIPVVIDAAAGFDALRPGRVPSVVSLHATKILGAGEGGFVVALDKALIVEVERRSNFGFMGGREARVASTNAKMSEYNAAVARAGLSEWASTRARFTGVAQTYARHLRRVGGVELMAGFGTSWVSTTAVVRFADRHGPTDDIVNALAARGVMTRRWWCRGLHEEDAFAAFGRESLPVTVSLAASTLGLPCFIDMNRFDIAYVCSSLEEVLQQTSSAARTAVAA